MKKIISFSLCFVLIILSLTACNKKTTSSQCIYKEYDISDITFSKNEVDDILSQLYSDEDYAININVGDLSLSKTDYFILSKGETGKKNAREYFNLFIYENINESHTEYLFELKSISPLYYNYVVIRINNLLAFGTYNCIEPLLSYFSIQGIEKTIESEKRVVKAVNKEIDILKLKNIFESNNFQVYNQIDSDNDEKISFNVVNSAGSSLMVCYVDNNYEAEYNYNHVINSTEQNAGYCLKYNNCAFIFLDDFWLDMIKQCEK